ncbi:MAG: amino acid adenylation domain-containing protein, partial [Eggerthellaceae bacterium]|nr:amino acid adenylation domain-containing protein [Eggerthellaceae bacterium]
FADFESATELSPYKPGREERGPAANAAAPFDFAAVERASQAAGVTPAGYMLAASAYALSRYANDRRVYLSTISSGRADVRTAETVGMFVNTLPLALEIADESRAAFVQRAAAALAGAIADERYPFARVAADHGFTPQVMYEYQIGVVDGVSLPQLVEVESLEADAAKFKCTIRIEQGPKSPQIALHYNDALYSADLAIGVARSIAIVAEKLAAAPDEPVRSIDRIDDDRALVLERFHEVAIGPADFAIYHEGLERQAERIPQATALVAVDGTFTFAQLNAWSNRIAHALIARGVPQRSRVALLLPRTARVIMAMFGVMKAGCAYIPCDPTYPEERVNHILGDSGAPLVITTSDRVADYEGAVDVEELLACDREDNPAIDVSPDDLADLIYTSGSTGKPKGVMLTHRGVCNFHANHPSNILVDALVNEAHALLAVTTMSFDMSVKEVGTPLVNGLAVVLADETQVNDPGKLAELFRKTGADAFNATHSRLAQYLELPAFADAIGRCKVVLSGGEKYTEGLLPRLQAITKARIINTYGPTETTVSSNMADLTHANSIDVGRPLYNVRECIVDADGNELPVGVVGELLIGGPGVALGYNNLPDKTAEVFIERDGERMYRSGDYARWTPEGAVEILGRTDNQVKLRGLRIEIGEVEAALAAVAGVKSSVVKIAEIRGVEHLCAYYTAAEPLAPATVRDEMARTLAKYMVPTAYLQLDALPLTPNGKIDYRGLPSAELLRTGEAVAAANEVEQLFCDIFGDILGLDDVGATDSFFEIGGTSLMAIRITVAAADAGYEITYSDVFANPTPRALAAVCGAGAQASASASDADKGGRDSEVEDFDYAAIDGLLAQNNLRSFVEGARRPLGNILLTGAAGYLGIHILREFVETCDGTAYCLLRGRGDISAETRLKHQLFYYFEDNYADRFGSRIVVVEGDVTRELPLGADVRIDTVVNCAAVVKHFSSGTEIEDVNVGGVANLVEFCLARGAELVQVSTGSTVKCPLKPGKSVMGKVGERELYIGQDLSNKYTRSKFMAERLVLDAVAQRGLCAKVMRVGNLAPRTADGEFQINYGTNAAMGRLKSFALLGCAPYDQLDATMEFSPIDQTARAILLLAQTPASCVLFHPFNHHAVFYGDVFAAMGRCGLPVKPVERERFASVLREAEADPAKASVLTSMLAYARKATGEPAVVPVAGNAYTMQVLYRLGFSWSPTPPAYVEQFLAALEGLGFFDDGEE